MKMYAKLEKDEEFVLPSSPPKITNKVLINKVKSKLASLLRNLLKAVLFSTGILMLLFIFFILFYLIYLIYLILNGLLMPQRMSWFFGLFARDGSVFST